MGGALRHTAFMVPLLFMAFGCSGNGGEEGTDYHEKTSLPVAAALQGRAAEAGEPEGKKRSARLPTISLPEADYRGMPLEEAIRKRRSVRSYSGKPMEIAGLSSLLFSAQGITGELYGTKLRAAPSAGALYPIEVYVIVHNVSGLTPGLYHYNPFRHSLAQLRKKDFRRDISRAGLGQGALKEANLVIVLTAVPARTTGKYGERGLRYIYMEAGHIAENILLQSVSLGMGAVPIGAFSDDKLDELLGIDGSSEMSLYLVAVGQM
jgi:SagB-type dehydrogenase family enzyme